MPDRGILAISPPVKSIRQIARGKLTQHRGRYGLFFGDLEAAFAASDVIVENTYTVPVVHQGYIEPHGVTAYWDRPDHVTLWECVQGAWGRGGT